MLLGDFCFLSKTTSYLSQLYFLFSCVLLFFSCCLFFPPSIISFYSPFHSCSSVLLRNRQYLLSGCMCHASLTYCHLTSASSVCCHALLSLQTSIILLLPSCPLDMLFLAEYSMCREQTLLVTTPSITCLIFCGASEHQAYLMYQREGRKFYTSFTHRPPLCLPSLLFIILLTHGWEHLLFMLSLVCAKALESNLYTAAACGLSKVFYKFEILPQLNKPG